MRTIDGRWLTRRVLPYLDKSGEVDGLVVTFLDVTRRRRDEEKLRRAEESRRIALDAAAMGMWWWDAGGERSLADERVRELLGHPSPRNSGLTREALPVAHRSARPRPHRGRHALCAHRERPAPHRISGHGAGRIDALA